eukprot:189147_1
MSSKECSPGVQELLLQFNLEQYNHKLAECGYSSSRNIYNIPVSYKEEAVSNVFGISDIKDKIKMLTVINTIQENTYYTPYHNDTGPMELPPVIQFSAAIDLTHDHDRKRKFSEMDIDIDEFADFPPPKRRRMAKDEDIVVEQEQSNSDESTESEDERTETEHEEHDDEMTQTDDDDDDEETESEDLNDPVEDTPDEDTESDDEDEEDEDEEVDELDWDKIAQYKLSITSAHTSKSAPPKWEKWEFDYIHKKIKKQLKHKNKKMNWVKISCKLALKTKRNTGGRPWRTASAIRAKAERDLEKLLRLKRKRRKKKKPRVLQEAQQTASDSATEPSIEPSPQPSHTVSVTESCTDTIEAMDLDHSDHRSVGEIENGSNACDDTGNLSVNSEIAMDPLDENTASSIETSPQPSDTVSVTESCADTIQTMDSDHSEHTHTGEIENVSNTRDDNLNVMEPLDDEGETTEEETVSVTNNASETPVNKAMNQTENENEIRSDVNDVIAKDNTMQEVNGNVNTNVKDIEMEQGNALIVDMKQRPVSMKQELRTKNVDINETHDNDVEQGYTHKHNILWPEPPPIPKGREQIHKRVQKKHMKWFKRYIAMRKQKGYSVPKSISCIFCGTYEL